MASTVFATFRTEAEAERALSLIGSQVSLTDSAVLSQGAAGKLTLDAMDLNAEERSACEAQLKRGDPLMIAQAATDEAADALLRLLHGTNNDGAPLLIAEASGPRTDAASAAAPAPAPERAAEVVEEQRIPLVEEDLRVGKREVVRGRASVHSHMSEAPVHERVELMEEEISIDQRPVNRQLTREEVAQSGLLQDRVFQFTSMREEAVVTKQPFVREEVVVVKEVKQRTQEIHDTVRRTEVETERLQPGETRGR